MISQQGPICSVSTINKVCESHTDSIGYRLNERVNGEKELSYSKLPFVRLLSLFSELSTTRSETFLLGSEAFLLGSETFLFSIDLFLLGIYLLQSSFP